MCVILELLTGVVSFEFISRRKQDDVTSVRDSEAFGEKLFRMRPEKLI